MLHREPDFPPVELYPIDDWALIEKEFTPEYQARMETLFALSNGFMGMRGTFEEGIPVAKAGTYINAFYESWPIVHGEYAYGFARTGQTLVNVTDAKIIKLFVDDEAFSLAQANVQEYERRLDMRSGTLERHVLWRTPRGTEVRIDSKRLVSFEHRHLALIVYEVTVLNRQAPIVISSEMVTPMRSSGDNAEEDVPHDPRKAPKLPGRVLYPAVHYGDDGRVVLAHRTKNSDLRIACGMDHDLDTECEVSAKRTALEDFGQVAYSIEAEPGASIRLAKFVTYQTSPTASPEQLCGRVDWSLDRAKRHGEADLLESQRVYVTDFWERTDVEIEAADEAPPGSDHVQQALRVNLFHLLQASARADGAGIAAKGLTSDGYEGHYFWDTEIYVMPFLTYTSPGAARNLLTFRYNLLDKARERARLVNQQGAKYPWRTINGEEASAFYAAGTAQYHINADIAYALRKYVRITGDKEFLYEEGAEILVETARLWADLGFFSPRVAGKFVIHGVTGPDEYTTVVDNNTFTNLMARENLRFAAETVTELRTEDPERYATLVRRTGVETEEVDMWKDAAAKIHIPYDEELGIHPQDDGFLEKEIWDFEGTPTDLYPLLLHFHPLVIYRFQVIKQADIVLAMLLLSEDFTQEEKRRNFDYYDPLTTGDSSLSPCVQAILAYELGETDLAARYAMAGMFMDLGDVAGNVDHGAHIAAMGGAWAIVVHGLAGLRDYDGRLRFHPRLSPRMKRVRFPLTVSDRRLRVEVGRESVVYSLEQGDELTLSHFEEEITLTKSTPVAERHIEAA